MDAKKREYDSVILLSLCDLRVFAVKTPTADRAKISELLQWAAVRHSDFLEREVLQWRIDYLDRKPD